MFAYCMCQGLKSLFLTPEESVFCEVWNESLCVETGIFVVNQGSRIDLFRFVTQMWICEGSEICWDDLFKTFQLYQKLEEGVYPARMMGFEVQVGDK